MLRDRGGETRGRSPSNKARRDCSHQSGFPSAGCGATEVQKSWSAACLKKSVRNSGWCGIDTETSWEAALALAEAQGQRGSGGLQAGSVSQNG